MKRSIIILCILSLIAIALVTAIGAWKLSHHAYNALDLAIYTQVFWNTSHGHFFESSIQNGNYLGDHVELYIFPLSVLFRLFPTPLFLIVLQAIIIFGSSLLVYKLSRLYLNNTVSLVLASALFLNPLIWNMALFEFHLLTFAIPGLLWMIYAYAKKSFPLFAVSGIVVVFIREDIGLVLIGMGLLAAIERRRLKWWLLPIILGSFWFLFALSIAGIANPDGYKFGIYYSWLGETPLDMLSTIFTRPLFFLGSLFSLSNILFLLALCVIFLGVPLLKSKYLIPIIFILLPILLGGFNVQILLETHYTATMIPFLIFASIAGLKTLPAKLERYQQLVLLRPLFIIIGFTVLVYTFLFLGPVVGGIRAMQKYSNYPAAASFIQEIPKSAPVFGSYGTLPILAMREKVFTYHYAVLGKKQFSEIPYETSPQPEHATFDLKDLTFFEMNYASRLTAKDEYPETYNRLQTLFSKFTIVRAHNQMLFLQATSGSTDAPNALMQLIEKTQDENSEGHNVGPIRIDYLAEEYNDVFPGKSLILKYTIKNPDSDAANGYAFTFQFNNEEQLTVPVGWNLWPLHATNAGDVFIMHIPLSGEQQGAQIQNIALYEREGYVKLDGLRSAEVEVSQTIIGFPIPIQEIQ